MTATLIMGVICVAGVLFMIRFLMALFTQSTPKLPCRVVYLSSRPTQTESGGFGLIPKAGFGRSDMHGRSRFEVIAGGTEPAARRVG
jgi:hypothetical protein